MSIIRPQRKFDLFNIMHINLHVPNNKKKEHGGYSNEKNGDFNRFYMLDMLYG
ncbi:hypothetical protein [Peribacillus simplex]|uniref:hypothetical protein n=1 Tax=Peribacillus simplex TaxID=1478 RepID=UPI003D08031F